MPPTWISLKRLVVYVFQYIGYQADLYIQCDLKADILWLSNIVKSLLLSLLSKTVVFLKATISVNINTDLGMISCFAHS